MPASNQVSYPRPVRDHDLARLGSEPLDVLVVGGGITGAGTALDAAARGLSVGLVEAQDWASGTSSRSSKLIHGGLRYLEMLDFRLVHEGAEGARPLLGRLAPHLVHPVPILWPLRRPVVERAYVGAGIALYDLLGLSTGTGRGLPLHRHLSRRRAMAMAPGLRPDVLKGAILYYDAQVDDARYVVDVVRTAAALGDSGGQPRRPRLGSSARPDGSQAPCFATKKREPSSRPGPGPLSSPPGPGPRKPKPSPARAGPYR